MICASGAGCSQQQSEAQRPNIIVILADDFGWGSVGSYGAPAALKTPNIDRLAQEGRRFTNAYAPSSVCSPTRYGLMTGRYDWRTRGDGGGVIGALAPLQIEFNRLTLASLYDGTGPVDKVKYLTEAPEKHMQRNSGNPYAAMVDSLDEGVGRVLDTLDASGLVENTLVIFVGDNGGYPGKNWKLRGEKSQLFEGGILGAAGVAMPENRAIDGPRWPRATSARGEPGH